MRKIILSILGVVIIIGSFFLARQISESKNRPKAKVEKVVKTVFTQTVSNGMVPIIVPANGNLRAQRRVELYAEVQGVFQKGNKLFKAGQPYRQGETIQN